MENEKLQEELEQTIDKKEEENKFNGYFHERDSLSENNIVDEV